MIGNIPGINFHGVHRTTMAEIRNAMLRGEELGPLDLEDIAKILTHEIERLFMESHPKVWAAREAARRAEIAVSGS